MRKFGMLLPLLALAGCIPSSGGRPTHRPGYARVPAAAPDLKMCLADLSRARAQYQLLPDRDFGNGCSATEAVKLIAVGIPITNLGAMKCALATPFAQWVHDTVPAIAQAWIDSPVVKIESFGTYACRPVNNTPGNKLSEHARADAVDIAAFILADGRRITVKDGWNGPDAQARAFLRALHASACRRFHVVLGPDANAYHHDHFHFDMGPGPYCR